MSMPGLACAMRVEQPAMVYWPKSIRTRDGVQCARESKRPSAGGGLMQRVDGARLAALAARATGIRARELALAKKALRLVARLELRRVVAVADGCGESIHGAG